MPPSIPSPNLKVKLETLTTESFAPFGTVIQNPAHSARSPSTEPPEAIKANQGSALKYPGLSDLSNYYPDRTSANPVISMFVCKPRTLRTHHLDLETERLFNVEILERHPYTPQTFIPLGLAGNDRSTNYLVIVAPTVSPSREDSKARPKPYPVPNSTSPTKSRKEIEARPKPYTAPIKGSLWSLLSRARPAAYTNSTSPPQAPPLPPTQNISQPKGTGPPDLSQLRAFLADGSQAVTYGPGTWHAPMVVLGAHPIDFVVVQYANGVSEDDCQEILLEKERNGEGVRVIVEVTPMSRAPLRAKL